MKGVVESAARALALVTLNCEPVRKHVEKQGGMAALLQLVDRVSEPSVLVQVKLFIYTTFTS